MSDQLPDVIKVQNLAETGRILEGNLSLACMQRLALQLVPGSCEMNSDGLGSSDANQVSVRLEFGVDIQGVKFLSGRIVVPVKLICQRCMGSMDYKVDAAIQLAMVKSAEEAEELPDRYEPLFIDGPELSLIELIEDELILALPIVALHPIDTCPAAAETELQGTQSIETEDKPNPFVVLAQLKNKQHSSH